jgi:hypothetical protein
MTTPVPPRKKKGSPWRAGILRIAIGAVLIVVSIWGISLCRGIFRAYVGPGSLPGDSLFASLGAWASWGVFFAPLGIGGVALVWSSFRNVGALNRFAFWLEDRAVRPDTLLAKNVQIGGIVPQSKTDDPHGLESLSTVTVGDLQRAATRAATIIGGLAGTFVLGAGIFGLGYLLILSRTYSSSSIYDHFAVGRIMISFALFSGMLVLLGFTILRHTFGRDNNGWLLPLRVFICIISRRRTGKRTELAGQHRPGTRQHPRV